MGVTNSPNLKKDTCDGQYLGLLQMLTVKAFSETDFLERGLTKIFTVSNFGNTLAMTIIYFFNMFKFWFRFQKWNEKLRKTFCFSDHCNWIGGGKFSQSQTRYLPSALNVLINTPNFSRNTRGDIFQIDFPESDEKTC